ncbi:ribosome maturation factor RimP [soil metagenome]
MSTKTHLWDLVESYLGIEHLELDDLDVLGSGKARTVKVVVDDLDLDLDRLAEVSRGLSRLFDAESDLDGPYQLEVTSPGLERPLKRPSHFLKSIGREVIVKARDEAGSVHTHRGVLTHADEDFATVTIDGEEHRFAQGDVISARTVFRWEAAPKPGR